MADLPEHLVELVVVGLRGPWDLGEADPDELEGARTLVEEVLAALFDACEVREEWGGSGTSPDDGGRSMPDCWRGSREAAVAMVASRTAKGFPAESCRLIRRYHLTTPAEVVSSPGEDQTDAEAVSA